jgi:hypothetical protein
MADGWLSKPMSLCLLTLELIANVYGMILVGGRVKKSLKSKFLSDDTKNSYKS